MSKKFKFNKPWKRWNTGDVIDEYEYRRLPIEIKRSSVVEYIPEPAKAIIQEPVRVNYFKPKVETPIERIIEEFTTD